MRKHILTFFLLSFLGLQFPCLSAGQLDPLLQGKHFLEAGEHDKAYDFFWALFQKNPQDATLNFFLGRAALAKGDYEAAVMAFERTLIIDPLAVEVNVELAKSFYGMGATQTAINYFEESLKGELPEDIRREINNLLDKIKKAAQ